MFLTACFLYFLSFSLVFFWIDHFFFYLFSQELGRLQFKGWLELDTTEQLSTQYFGSHIIYFCSFSVTLLNFLNNILQRLTLHSYEFVLLLLQTQKYFKMDCLQFTQHFIAIFAGKYFNNLLEAVAPKAIFYCERNPHLLRQTFFLKEGL